MTRDCHAGICGSRRVRLPPATRRFVRERSSADPAQPRPFSGFDLQDQQLAGLQLRGADFSNANLRNAILVATDLSSPRNSDGSFMLTDFTDADLDHANFGLRKFEFCVLLRGQLAVCADLACADLTGADLREAKLAGAEFTFAKYDKETAWPPGFEVPKDARKSRLLKEGELGGGITPFTSSTRDRNGLARKLYGSGSFV